MPHAPRWVEVTPSPFTHEAEGLRTVRDLLPQTSPYRAWSNVEFRDGQGKWHEVDLIVLGQRRLHLVELKYYSGTLRGDDLRWLRDGHRAEDSPLKLARRKAQRLASRLRDELVRWAEERGVRPEEVRHLVPWVQESVFLHHPGLRCALPRASQVDLFGLDDREATSGLPGISTRLLEPPAGGQAVSRELEGLLVDLMGRIGLVQRRQRELGSWVIDDEPLGEGEGWQDWSATHRHIGADRARIRVRVVPPGAERAERDRIRKVVEHEYRVMTRLAHDGLLRPRDLLDDELGIGLVYPYDEDFQRLDLWQAERPQGVSLVDQLNLVRQVAEAVGYAHRHRVVHRGLTPFAVSVKTTRDAGLQVLVGDWQSSGSVSGEALTGMATSGVTALAATEVRDRLGAILQPAGVDADRRTAEAFQAPEGVWNRDADRVRLDVFALGALTYFVLAGRPPAPDRAGLRDRLLRDRGLDLAADLPQVSSALRTLVLEATRPAVSDRLPDVGAFLDRLAQAERALTSGDEVSDPLEANPGDVVGDRWQLERRLGAGSTAVGLLVSDLTAGSGPEARRVLKVGINDAAVARLDAEADVLRSLDHPRIVRLAEGPVQLGTRRALVLHPAGDQTLAEVLYGRPRLSLDLLERWGADLLQALTVLDRAGIDHRDIKPANLGVREERGERGDRAKHLVLFDFSLARAGATAVNAGTPPYLDPFLESPGRGRYDSAAERYSAAVVLFEMATGATPVFGDGLSDPAAVPDEAAVHEALFDPAVAPALVDFFRTALARKATQRHHTAADMLSAWTSVFVPLPMSVPDDAEARVEAAQPSTPLAEAGLSARALSALEPFGVSTVGDLVALDPVRLNRLSGVAEPTRREVKQRAKQWRDRFGSVVTGRSRLAPAADAGTSPTPTRAAQLLLDAVGSARAQSRRKAAGLMLGLERGLDAFATQDEVAAALGFTRARAAQMVSEMQDAWAANPATCAVLQDVGAVATRALADLGGVGTVEELAGAVLAALPAGDADGVFPERLAAGLLRAALDRLDALQRADADEAGLTKRRRQGRVLAVATEAELLDLADALGRRADELVFEARSAAEPVVARGRAVGALREMADQAGDVRTAPADERLLRLAAAFSQAAAISGRGELHARDLEPVPALQLALAGVGGGQEIAAQEIRDRVRARFPALPPLPDRPRLDALIDEAGLPLLYDEQLRAFRAPVVAADTTGLESRVVTAVAPSGAPLSVSGGQLDRRLAESARSRSFLALGVEAPRADRAVEALVKRHGAHVVDLTGVLIDELHRQAEGRIPWPAVVAADARPLGTREAEGLARLVALALPGVERAIEDAAGEADDARPVLLVEAAPLARYDQLALLSRWTDLAAPRQQAIWLLVPQLSGNTGAMIDGRPLPLAAPGQFVRLDEEWLTPLTAPAGR
ncbi:serine/threonine protein kinase [Geodermatophilus tzadiensis]|uniref:non-specific serine/threonine protein kinase n=1 Tax=Geodermatophilus tzadiensis TaxID=1137988 RepID=A0A2T0SUT9_9ACTN|nr:BREX system serine/threonine kinase PglW [Geodermatophilus tzadiensis]PRY37175.1 serine/threonine protein kinase [Geodermatophilus tzadiensis]